MPLFFCGGRQLNGCGVFFVQLDVVQAAET
jgi:hypothetical protein